MRALAPPSSLYVHVPFCAHKCEYCAFYSHAPSGAAVDRYVTALIRELEGLPRAFKPRTLFFGGGTPSLLNLKQWRQIFEALERLGFTGAAEWTVECNPATLSADKAALLRDHGVNRVSMGVQSFNPDLLERLGRIHTREMVFKSFDILRRAGFDNLNLDLMFAIPGQTLEIWEETINQAVALGSEHLSCYEVIYEEDTPLYAQLQAGQFAVDESLACDMHEMLIDRVGEKGFRQYEIANFARHLAATETLVPDRACQHNLNYWHGGSFYGAGPSATGYVGGVRTRNWANTTLYCELIEAGRSPIESREELSPLARAGETAAFGLRMTAGWSFTEFQAVTGFDLREEWPTEMKALVEEALAAMDNERFRLTRQGLRFADAVAEKFIKVEPAARAGSAKPVAAGSPAR